MNVWGTTFTTLWIFYIWSTSATENFQFIPLPGTSVCAHCRWEIKLDTVYNRIPSTITEILCRNPNSTCGGNTNYHCRQIRAKMVVAYTDPLNEDTYALMHKQNTTISIGCSCVRQRSHNIQFRLPPTEKRMYIDN
jgi:hypothetical protein